MLRAQQGSPVSTLGSKYILYNYMDALGVGCTDMKSLSAGSGGYS